MTPQTDAERAAFVREHTALEAVPFVPSIRLRTATEVVSLWRATESWLSARGLAVPYWCVPWAGGQALARFVLDHPETVRGLSVVDFGTGSGLVAIAAAQAGAARVRAVDVDPTAIAACRVNIEENGGASAIEVALVGEDFAGSALGEPSVLAHVDVLLAGDVWYEREPSERFAAWFARLVKGGTRVLTADPGRSYVPGPARARELARYEIPTTAELESTSSRVTRVLEMT